MYFYGASGVEFLNIPVRHGEGFPYMGIRDVEIDYAFPWRAKAKRALVSAYGRSAYFEFFKDEFFSLLLSGNANLWDYNLALINFFRVKFAIRPSFSLLSPIQKARAAEACGGSVAKDFPLEKNDFRRLLHPKKNDIFDTCYLPYYQVFADKFGFKKNLSSLDLLFNLGPEGGEYLQALAEKISASLKELKSEAHCQQNVHQP